MMTNPVTVQELVDASLDVTTIEQVTMNNGFTGDSTTNRDGVPVDTLEGRLKRLGYDVPVVYAGGIVFAANDRTKTVDELGVIYAPRPTALPFTTDGTFANDAAKFFTIQGGKQSVAVSLDILKVDTTIPVDTDNSYPSSEYVTGSGEGAANYKKVSVNPGNDELNPATSDGNWLLYLLDSSGYVNPLQAGADSSGVIDSTAACRACIASGFPVKAGTGTFKLLLAASEDLGNDSIIKLDTTSTTSKVFIGSGQATIFKLDAAASFAGDFNVIGLDLRAAGFAGLEIGNFTIDGDKANTNGVQTALGLRLQSGTTITADYEVNLLPVWVHDLSENGVTFGANKTFFDTIVSDDCDGHGASVRNITGDGREIQLYGNSIIVTNAGKNIFDYSGDSQVNNGPCKSHIGTIDGVNGEFGVKIAGDHDLVLDKLKLVGTKQLTTLRSNVAVSFRSAKIGLFHSEDSASNSLTLSDGGSIHIDKMISINSAAGGDILQTDGRLTVLDFSGVGGAAEVAIRTSTGAIYTDIAISKLENYGSSPSGVFPIDIRGDGFCRISGGLIGDQKSDFHIIKVEQAATGSLHLNGFDIKGGGAATKAINQVAGDLGNTYLTNFNALKCTGTPSIVEAGAIPLHRSTVLAAVGMQQFANNAAAIVGGLLTGDEYGVTGTDPLQKAEVF